MILIDANSLIILLLGLMDPKIINTHRRTSIYDEKDYEVLLRIIDNNISKLVILPNVWTEVDNLLNNFSGDRRWSYIQSFKNLTDQTTEKYLSSKTVANHFSFPEIGLTDSLLLECAKDCSFLITSDSKLSDLARANSINVIDLVQIKNSTL